MKIKFEEENISPNNDKESIEDIGRIPSKIVAVIQSLCLCELARYGDRLRSVYLIRSTRIALLNKKSITVNTTIMLFSKSVAN